MKGCVRDDNNLNLVRAEGEGGPSMDILRKEKKGPLESMKTKLSLRQKDERQ